MFLTHYLDRNAIVSFLDQQDRQGGKHSLALRLDDPRVDWHSLCGELSEPNPSIDHGQKWALRCKLSGGRALHVLGHGDVVVMHIDEHDPGVRPVRHLVAETNLVPGMVLTSVLALLAVALGAPAKVAVAVAASGALAGAIAPVGMTVWQYDRVDMFGRSWFSKRVGITPSMLLNGAATV